ncbi:UNVERIFIED_CONTAM: E3 ubiquitin-protein ligase SPL2 [Sesamum calycinum]|uniref:RING-type E3 ubiquitin transferase n=1 Tax=Sesamum calycinum TaxID=2727403 RepID=A0AAW2NCV7_9LAMI
METLRRYLRHLLSFYLSLTATLSQYLFSPFPKIRRFPVFVPMIEALLSFYFSFSCNLVQCSVDLDDQTTMHFWGPAHRKFSKPNLVMIHGYGGNSRWQFVYQVPFILVEEGKWPQSDYLVVNMEGSRHPLPLMTVYQHLQPINASPYTFLQALFGLEYPVGLLYEEKILPLGKDITAVGICNIKNGIPEIKSCKDLPYFLTDLTKDQLVADLSFKTKVLMWSGLVFGSLAIGILGYSIARNWIRWKEWRYQQRAQQQNNSTGNEAQAEVAAEEESGDVPDGELCVICLMRRRRSAFIPCGHLVCCQRCALSVEREVLPKCPVCRQPIRSSVRIYDS